MHFSLRLHGSERPEQVSKAKAVSGSWNARPVCVTLQSWLIKEILQGSKCHGRPKTCSKTTSSSFQLRGFTIFIRNTFFSKVVQEFCGFYQSVTELISFLKCKKCDNSKSFFTSEDILATNKNTHLYFYATMLQLGSKGDLLMLHSVN